MYRKQEENYEEQRYLRSHDDSLQMARDDSGVGLEYREGRDYELTFKKNQNGMFIDDQKQEHSVVLSATQRQLVSHLKHPISYYENMSLDSLSILPFADLYSIQLPERQKSKLTLIGQLLQHKRLYLKSRSVSLNYRCLSLNESPSYEDKNRLFILELLEKQLNKKCFIQALKINYLKKRYNTFYGKEEMQNDYNPEKMSPRKINEQLFGQEDEEEEQARQWEQADRQWQRNEQGSYEEDYNEEESQYEGQVLILIQVVSSITKRLIFSAFKTILDSTKNINRSARGTAEALSPIPTNRRRQVRINSPQQVLSNQHIHIEHESHLPETNYLEPSHQQQQQQEESQASQLKMHERDAQFEQELEQEGQYQQNQVNQLQERLNELEDYIEELHDQAAQTDSILRQFFIRWKIRLFESIADNLIDQLREYQKQSFSQAQIHGQRSSRINRRLTSEERSKHQQYQQEEEEERIEDYWSRNTTELSQADSNLKHEKSQLKEYLYQNQLKIFFRNLSYHHENTMIKSICRKVYRAKVIAKVMEVLKSNCWEEKRMRDMDDYYEQIAEEQEEDDATAFYFWKTNLLHRYFKMIKENKRDTKMARVLDEITIKLAFKTLKKYSYQGKKTLEALERFRTYRESKTMFKYFSVWKQLHRSSCKHYEKLKAYKLFKNQEIKGHIFSILKLGFKKMLIKQIKAEKHAALVMKDKVFQHLKLIAEDSNQFRYKQETLRQYLIFLRGRQFTQSCVRFYKEYRQYQILTVKEEKLRRTMVNLHALKAVKAWRRRHMKKTIYETVEDKLRRLNQKQKKQEILNIWINQTIKSSKRDSPSTSERHKKWLVNYYSGLCTVLPN